MVKIAIASGKGGTGKTFVSTNLYQSLLKRGANVSLTDCDAEEPNAAAFFNISERSRIKVTQKVPVIDVDKCVYCGRCQDWCAYNAIIILKERNIAKVMEEMCHDCGACFVACNYGAITEKDVDLGDVTTYDVQGLSSLVEGRLKVGVYTPVPVLKKAISATSAEIEIFDSPPGTSCPFIHTVNASDYIILVTEPTPFGLNDLKLSVEILRQMEKRFSVIVNRAGLGCNEVYEYLENEKIDLLAEIPFDRNYAEIYSKGGLVTEENEGISLQFDAMANKILQWNLQ